MDGIEDTSPEGEPGEDGNDVAGNPPFDSRKPIPLEDDSQTADPAAEADEVQQQLTGIHLEDDSPKEDPPDGEEGPPDPPSSPDIEDTHVPEDLIDDAGVSPIPHQIPEDLPSDDIAGAPAPEAEELQGIQDALQAFGEQVNQFHDAGGIAGGGEGGLGGAASPDTGYEGTDGGQGGLQDFAEANTQLHATHYEFLRDHARALNDLQRRLEIERL